MQYNFEIIPQEVCNSTEDTLSYPVHENLSDFSGSYVSLAFYLVSISSVLSHFSKARIESIQADIDVFNKKIDDVQAADVSMDLDISELPKVGGEI